ncbi:MAG: Xaa-Pro peptidase family protein [Treponema sp.]|nr:Xaa-Pro peptidase family protein [Treponema sp.]
MRTVTKEDLRPYYAQRRAQVAQYMKKNDIAVAVFEHTEGCEDPAIRYLTGFSSDGLLVFTSDDVAVLIPWDENLAKQQAIADKIIPYTKYGRVNVTAVQTVLNKVKVSGKMTCDLPHTTAYPLFLRYVEALSEWDVRCREKSVHSYVEQLRAVKDEYEIACTKEAARVGDIIIDTIEEQIKSGQIKTETDVALLIERVCREHGCERTGFDTLAAGPSRSFAIHCFPNYTAGLWPDTGLSILDFGVVINGYTSDTTITVAKGPLTDEQEHLLQAVQHVYDVCLDMYKKDVPIMSVAKKANELFAESHDVMPHSLGHGIGLEIHEAPVLRVSGNPENVFKPGMIVTLEPGLYNADVGGARLENDVLITEEGNEVISHARIIRL